MGVSTDGCKSHVMDFPSNPLKTLAIRSDLCDRTLAPPSVVERMH